MYLYVIESVNIVQSLVELQTIKMYGTGVKVNLCNLNS